MLGQANNGVMLGEARPAIGVQAAGHSKTSSMIFWTPKSMQNAPRGPAIYRPAFPHHLISTTSAGAGATLVSHTLHSPTIGDYRKAGANPKLRM